MRRSIVFAVLLGSTLAAMTYPAHSQTNPVDPPFNCKYARDSVRQMLCHDEAGADADWSMTSAFWALRFSIAESERDAFDLAQNKWLEALAQECRLKAGQTDFAAGDIKCVVDAIDRRTAQFLAQLQGDALAEATLPREAHFEIQNGLAAFGFFDGSEDGKLGPQTRAAIRRFLKSRHLPPSDFLSDDQRTEIFRQSQTSISADTLRRLRSPAKRKGRS